MHRIGYLDVINTGSTALVEGRPYIALEVDGGLQSDIVAFATQSLKNLVQRIDLRTADRGHKHQVALHPSLLETCGPRWFLVTCESLRLLGAGVDPTRRGKQYPSGVLREGFPCIEAG